MATPYLQSEPGLNIRAALLDFGLLTLRIVFGGFMLLGHGIPKLRVFASKPSEFPDPLGIGNLASFYGAIGAEVVCAALVLLGLFTRVATLPLIFAMAVAAFVMHASDPFFMAGGAAKEPAMIYLLGSLAIALTGPGRLSLDFLLMRKFMGRPIV